MSISSYINSPPVPYDYKMVNLGTVAARAIAAVADGNAVPTVIYPILKADDTTAYLTIPAGTYRAQMSCALQGTVANTVIPFMQQVIIDDSATPVILGFGPSLCITTGTNTTYGDTVVLSDNVVFSVTKSTNITVKLTLNPITNPCAMINGNLPAGIIPLQSGLPTLTLFSIL